VIFTVNGQRLALREEGLGLRPLAGVDGVLGHQFEEVEEELVEGAASPEKLGVMGAQLERKSEEESRPILQSTQSYHSVCFEITSHTQVKKFFIYKPTQHKHDRSKVLEHPRVSSFYRNVSRCSEEPELGQRSAANCQRSNFKSLADQKLKNNVNVQSYTKRLFSGNELKQPSSATHTWELLQPCWGRTF